MREETPEEERLDIVDEGDRVIGVLGRKEVHRRRLLHRAVHVFVLDGEGRLYLQRRAWSKDEHPGRWDSSCSGHVDSGESYGTAAERELEEELGIRAELVSVFKVTACPDTDGEHSMLYLARAAAPDQTPRPNPEEIIDGRFVSLESLETELAASPEKFTPSFRLLFRRYRALGGR